jgi:hypothetical protein
MPSIIAVRTRWKGKAGGRRRTPTQNELAALALITGKPVPVAPKKRRKRKKTKGAKLAWFNKKWSEKTTAGTIR